MLVGRPSLKWVPEEMSRENESSQHDADHITH